MALEAIDPRSAAARLDTVRALTDAYLGNLDIDDVLREVTRRICEALAVDTATVLLVDGDSGQLVARAAYGLEEEVRQGVRVTIGRGFAGWIAEHRQPLVLDHIDKTTVENPLLWERGLHAMLGVPIMSGAVAIGVLHVGSIDGRVFTPADAASLQEAAGWVADAVVRRRSEIDRGPAQILQRSLLPSALPRISGVEFATRYVVAEVGGVGGDWYDAFRVPSGDLWVMTGDVEGHGLSAAVIMGRLRAALRAYALLRREPEEVLALADHKIQLFEPGAVATVCCAVLRPPYDSVRIASAGHPPPVLAAPGKATTLVEVPTAVPLGVLEDLSARSVTVDLPVGAALVTYTDGLIERRGESLDAGFERLVATVRPSHPEVICREVMDALVGRSIPRDDIAVIAMQRVEQAPEPERS